jgi:tetratricopeptide (TPR) repeat protein
MTEKRYEAITLAEIEDPTGWAPLRKRLGVESFGVNAWTAHAAGDRIIPEHDETPSGHEELYVVTAGHASFTVNGEDVDAPAGTVVFVRDPDVQRGASAREAGTTVLAVGGRPGDVYQPRAWEVNAQMPALFDSGEHEKAKEVLTRALGKYEDNSGILYNLACAEALMGNADEAIEHLKAALEGHPAYAESAREDPDFELIRSDPRFGELVGAP